MSPGLQTITFLSVSYLFPDNIFPSSFVLEHKSFVKNLVKQVLSPHKVWSSSSRSIFEKGFSLILHCDNWMKMMSWVHKLRVGWHFSVPERELFKLAKWSGIIWMGWKAIPVITFPKTVEITAQLNCFSKQICFMFEEGREIFHCSVIAEWRWQFPSPPSPCALCTSGQSLNN